MHRSKILVFAITYRRAVSRILDAETDHLVVHEDRRFSAPVVTDFTERSVNFIRINFTCMDLLPLPNHPSSHGGSRADTKMLSTEFC